MQVNNTAKIVFIKLMIMSVILLLPQILFAQIKIMDKTEHYSIQGKTIEDVRQAMNIARLNHPELTDFCAYTKWQVNWQYRYFPSQQGCRLNNIEVTANIIILLPRWENVASTDLVSRQSWERFYHALVRHERGHREIAINAANAIARELNLQPMASNCQVLTQLANEKGNQLLQSYRAKEIEYDRITDHGRTQGAILGG
ncbi:MAG: DUF922 domain-containing protein [Legionellales bacterium]|nr:DUF922 domain-containing protein [Legionellales bacterium]